MLLLLAWPGITQGNEKLSTFHHVTRQTDISGVAIVAASRESVFTDTRVACDTFGGFATFLTFSATGFMFCPFRLFTIFPVIHTPQTPELKPAEGCVVLTSVLGEADPLVVLEAVLHTLLLVLILLILLVLMVLHCLHLASTNNIINKITLCPWHLSVSLLLCGPAAWSAAPALAQSALGSALLITDG